MINDKTIFCIRFVNGRIVQTSRAKNLLLLLPSFKCCSFSIFYILYAVSCKDFRTKAYHPALFIEILLHSFAVKLTLTTQSFISDPIAISQNNDRQTLLPNTYDRHYNNEALIQLDEEISQFLGQNVERQLDQVNTYHNPNASYNNGHAQTVLLSSNSRCSPPPPYDLCVNILNPDVQPSQYTHHILQFPPQQNIQYLHQHRLQYPQQESLQYHEELLHYPQRSMQYPYQREANYPTSYQPPIKRNCFTDWLCCWFFILPCCLLIFILYYFTASSDF